MDASFPFPDSAMPLRSIFHTVYYTKGSTSYSEGASFFAPLNAIYAFWRCGMLQSRVPASGSFSGSSSAESSAPSSSENKGQNGQERLYGLSV